MIQFARISTYCVCYGGQNEWVIKFNGLFRKWSQINCKIVPAPINKCRGKLGIRIASIHIEQAHEHSKTKDNNLRAYWTELLFWRAHWLVGRFDMKIYVHVYDVLHLEWTVQMLRLSLTRVTVLIVFGVSMMYPTETFKFAGLTPVWIRQKWKVRYLDVHWIELPNTLKPGFKSGMKI